MLVLLCVQVVQTNNNESNEQGSLGCASRAQGPGGDKVGLGQGPHTRAAGMQVNVVVVVQGGQDGGQAHLLARSQAFHQRHSNLLALLYLRSWGPKRPMRGIMEHALGWCK
jgi:hypothetical protein